MALCFVHNIFYHSDKKSKYQPYVTQNEEKPNAPEDRRCPEKSNYPGKSRG
jgi:hypothetical protein